jgi:hypothetical protein
MQLDIEYLQRAILTVDYESAPRLFDQQGELMSLFVSELPQLSLGFDQTTKSFLRMQSGAGDRSLHIGFAQFTYFADRLRTLDVFTQAAAGKTRTFLSATSIEPLTRLGIRLIYRIPVEFKRFVPLSTWYDIPGIQDPRISEPELIHYQINLQEEHNRIIITFGQQSERDHFYRTIDLHHQYFGEVKVEKLEDTISHFMNVLLDKYKGFQKEG